jgi:hypothetical protein
LVVKLEFLVPISASSGDIACLVNTEISRLVHSATGRDDLIKTLRRLAVVTRRCEGLDSTEPLDAHEARAEVDQARTEAWEQAEAARVSAAEQAPLEKPPDGFWLAAFNAEYDRHPDGIKPPESVEAGVARRLRELGRGAA